MKLLKIKEKLEKNNINLNNELVNEHIQKNFLETNLGKAINTAVDIGIRAIFPDFFEDQIIDIKDNLLNYGLKDGIRQTIDDAIDIGRSAIGIVTGNFESINQMQNAVKNGGIIDGISSLLDTVIDKVKKAGLINNTIAKTIKQGKNIILNNVENNITSTFNKQYESIDYANKYISNWKENFEKKDFSGMEKEYKKIEKQLNNIAPIEKTINEAKTIMTLHNLIKNNGNNFELSQEELEKRIKEIAEQITEEYENKELIVICILTGAVYFATDLTKYIKNDTLKLDFMKVSSYGNSTESTGEIKIKKDLFKIYEIKPEEIEKINYTMATLKKYLLERKPESLKICTLLDKKERRKVEIEVDYVGFEVPNKFVLGYGMDYEEYYRNLPYIAYCDD